MATGCYDCFFLLDSNKYNRDPGGVAAWIQKTIEDHGGEVLVNRFWEERRLAYPIKGHQKGTYWISYFRMDSSKVQDFHRACQLNDTIMRFLITKVDPRLIDTLVSHALGHVTRSEDEEATEELPDEEEAVAVGDGIDSDEDEYE